MYDIKMLKAKKLAELIEIAEQIGIKDLKGLKKQDIIDKIVGNASEEKSDIIEESDLNLDKIESSNVNSESSIISTFNSDNYMETYGNVKIKEINLSEESEDSDYSEEINEDEITAFEQELLSKT